MLVRLELRDDSTGNQFALFLPAREGESGHAFDPEGTRCSWPPVLGVWDRHVFYARVDHDEEAEELVLDCSDGDSLVIALRVGTALSVGRQFRVTSPEYRKSYLYRITGVEVP